MTLRNRKSRVIVPQEIQKNKLSLLAYQLSVASEPID